MAYYVRVLSTSSDCVPLSKLRSAIQKDQLPALLSMEEGTDDNWTQLILAHDDGQEIACIMRNLVHDGSLGDAEIAEFADDIVDCKPASAVKWLLDYFPRVRCVYAFQVLGGTGHKNGWEIFGTLKSSVWSFAPSIIQADYEGFSNEDGYHILWQFSEKGAHGNWWMGVLRDGDWKHFQMDLGNRKQQESFFLGQIPEGAKLA